MHVICSRHLAPSTQPVPKALELGLMMLSQAQFVNSFCIYSDRYRAHSCCILSKVGRWI